MADILDLHPRFSQILFHCCWLIPNCFRFIARVYRFNPVPVRFLFTFLRTLCTFLWSSTYSSRLPNFPAKMKLRPCRISQFHQPFCDQHPVSRAQSNNFYRRRHVRWPQPAPVRLFGVAPTWRHSSAPLHTPKRVMRFTKTHEKYIYILITQKKLSYSSCKLTFFLAMEHNLM
jgi:hypothetical protein